MNANTKNNKEFLDLATYAFHKPKTKERAKAFDKLLEFSTPYGHYENHQLTSMVIDSHFNVYWKNQEVKTSGIGYVASYPEFRGNGAIRQLKPFQEEWITPFLSKKTEQLNKSFWKISR